ncbi:ATP-binding cassette domain-containing protein [bacterium]|nr:ATP-binding cassette domain-containing protein [bacterium]
MNSATKKDDVLLDVRHLKKHFHVSRGVLHAVDDVSFTISKGKTLGLVGESGCGKSTLGRVVIGLIEATNGEVYFRDEDMLKFDGRKKSEFRKKAQIVFQDPFSSLNPRMSVAQQIAEPLIINKIFAKKVMELMDTVGLASRLATSFPHELDGGRRQRIGVARALALDPEFIVLDEPVSALDVRIQAQVLNMLQELKNERGYTYLFISHNLSVVRYVSDEVAVMYLGQIVEKAGNVDLFKEPMHPYTQALLSAVPIASLAPKKERILLEGDVPSPINLAPGCRFAGRCAYRQERCLAENPTLREISSGHSVACHFAGRLERHA